MPSDEITDPNEWLRNFFTRLHGLPEEKAMEAMLEVMNVLVTNLDREQVIALRAVLVEKCGENPEMLALIDGSLALRDLQKS